MHRTPFTLASLAALAFLVACERQEPVETGEMTTEPTVDVAAEEQAIRDLADRYEQAMATGDANAVLLFYTDDAIIIMPDGSAGSASETVGSFMAELPAGTTMSIDHAGTVVAASGDLAYDHGTLTLRSTGPDGQTVEETHQYLVTLEKVDGEWKLAATMDSGPIGEAAAR